MRPPSNPEALENKPATTDTVSRDPSYPDRARIDSDVRAFLRPVSTPWIVFDRDSRVGVDFAASALRMGAVFASSPSFRPEVIKAAEESGKSLDEVAALPLPTLSIPAPAAPNAIAHDDPFRAGGTLAPAMSSVLRDAGVFPPAPTASDRVVEPSNLVVASDVVSDSSSIESIPVVARSGSRRGRIAAIVGACAGVLVLASVVVGGARIHERAAAASGSKAMQAPAIDAVSAPAPVPTETIALGSRTSPAVPSSAATTTTPAAREPAAAKVPTDPKKRFGKLTLKGDATRKVVWFDGKRMLGSGQRTFLVLCGMHTVAVSDKADTKDIEVPCNGEYVVSK
jgi:hypothetical protein